MTEQRRLALKAKTAKKHARIARKIARDGERKPRQWLRERMPALLYTRAQVAELLNVSIMTVMRLEWSGELKGFKLTPGSDNSKVFFRVSDVHALIERRAVGKGAA